MKKMPCIKQECPLPLSHRHVTGSTRPFNVFYSSKLPTLLALSYRCSGSSGYYISDIQAQLNRSTHDSTSPSHTSGSSRLLSTSPGSSRSPHTPDSTGLYYLSACPTSLSRLGHIHGSTEHHHLLAVLEL